ncbi:MAG: hypothetical protein ABI587_07165 [Gemmatimonadales bacterium]
MSALVTHRVPGPRRPALIAGVVLIAIGLAMMLLANATLAGWIFLLPGGLLALIGTQPGGAPIEAIVVDDMGLSERIIGIGPIPWDQVVRVEAKQIRLMPVIGIYLTDSEVWLARMPVSHKRLVAIGATELGLPPVFFPAIRLDVPVERIVAEINQRARGSSR